MKVSFQMKQKGDINMEKIMFQNRECYVAYKGLSSNMRNFQNNYTYEVNNWYSVLDVDMEDIDCSYGLNVCKTSLDALQFGTRAFKCYVPINTKIKFIDKDSEFRCLTMYLTDEEIDLCDSGKYWEELTEEQRDLVCEHNCNFNYEKYWKELTKRQRDLVCGRRSTFDYDVCWGELTEHQRNLVCVHSLNFDYKKHWDGLTKDQKDLVCICNHDFDYEKYWDELTKDQKRYVTKHIVIKE